MNEKNAGLEINESNDKPSVPRVLPSCLRNGSNNNNTNPVVKNSRVSFPDDERDLVTGYLEPENPWDVGEYQMIFIYFSFRTYTHTHTHACMCIVPYLNNFLIFYSIVRVPVERESRRRFNTHLVGT